MKLVTAATMREMDRRTIDEFQISGLLLMENAALRIVEAIVERYGLLDGKRVVVLCGKGNNGGDGFAIARHMAVRYNAIVSVYTTFAIDTESQDHSNSSINLRAAEHCGRVAGFYEFKISDDDDNAEFKRQISSANIIIDAIFGTGLKKAVEGVPGAMIDAVNEVRKRTVGQVRPGLGVTGQEPAVDATGLSVQSHQNWGLGGHPYVVAVDVPSGVNADTGAVDGPAIQADLTVTFGLAKPGLICYPGASNVGELVIADICMPTAVVDEAPTFARTTEASDVAAVIPKRENGRDTNKGKFGHVLVVAGSRGFLGAASMSAHAAARTGAGLVTLAVPESLLTPAMSTVNPVIMTRGLPETGEGTFAKTAVDAVLALAEKVTAVAIGPGLSAHVNETAEFVREVVRRCPVPIVVDADALNILALETDHGMSIIASRVAATVLTPHPGEMGRLVGKSTADVQADRFGVARDVADRYRCTVLLKGARTVIASENSSPTHLGRPEHEAHFPNPGRIEERGGVGFGLPFNINLTGNPGMASGGMGDALTGVIGALLGMKLEPHAAASAGAYVHGDAGDIAAARLGGKAGLLATDLIESLPAALGKILG